MRHIACRVPDVLSVTEIMRQSPNASEQAGTLRRPGAIILLSCYELGHQPVGLAQPLGFLEEAGFSPSAMDMAVEDLDRDRIAQAALVAISVPMHTALRLGVQAADVVRGVNPTCVVCFYGLYASINADYLLGRVADWVIGGEYEIPLVRLVEALDRGAEPVDLEGVSRRGRLVPPLLTRMGTRSHSFSVPSRRRLPALARYAHLEHAGRRHVSGYVEASRGCLHRCRHCPIVPVYEGRFFIFPQAGILEDIRNQVRAGATHMTFGDPDFLNGPGHSLGIVRAMHEEFPDLTFDFTAKIEHLLEHRALLPEFRALGCLFVVSAVESFNDDVLAHLEKGHTRADALTALDSVRAAGITLRPSLVPFTPWSTLEEYVELFELVEAQGLIEATDPVQYTIRLLIPPGSALLAASVPGSVLARSLEGLDQANFQHRWRHPDPRMDRLHQTVTAAVEEAVRAGDETADIFVRVRGLAHQAAGRPVPTFSIPSRRAFPPPRLTESWFCCAEPTNAQLRPLKSPGFDDTGKESR
jgi:radical SAM superfamily enzyme YgiQ (UPF0313 family)